MGLILVILAVHIEGVQFAKLQGLQPGKVGLVAEHQVAAWDAPAIKHLVGDLAVPPGGVDQILHVPAILDFPGKESQLVQQPIEMDFLVDVGLIGLFLDDIQLCLLYTSRCV